MDIIVDFDRNLSFESQCTHLFFNLLYLEMGAEVEWSPLQMRFDTYPNTLRLFNTIYKMMWELITKSVIHN
jgi:hypothetical protein